MHNYQEYNTYNKTNIASTPRRIKQKIDLSTDSNNLNQPSKELNSKLSTNNNNITKTKKKQPSNPNDQNQEQKAKKTPKEILSSLLSNTLGKSLLKLESRAKEQLNTTKLIGKYFIVFEKNLISLNNGVLKKRKEDEKKQKMAKKMKLSSTPKLRSKTVTNIRKIEREDSLMHTGRNKSKYNIQTTSTYSSKKSNNLQDTPKIRSRTVKSSRYSSSYRLKAKTSKEINDERIENTPKRNNNINGYKTINRLSSGLSSRNTENSKEEEINRVNNKDKYNTLNNKTISSNNANKEKTRSRSRKNTTNREKEKDKEKDKGKLSRKNSLRKSNKKHSGSKQMIKIDNGDKNKKSLNDNNINNLKISNEINNSPVVDKISNFSPIYNNNKEVDLNENININQIISNKNKKVDNNVDNVLKELEEYNEKKPKLEEEKEQNKLLIERVRNRSKNKERKDNLSIDKEIEGSLNDVKLMIEGVSGVIDKIKSERSEKKIKFEKKTKSKEKADEEKIKKNIEEINKEVNELFKLDEDKMKNKEKEDEKIKEDIFIKSSVFPGEEKENNINNLNENEKDNFFPLKTSIKIGKESQIMNEEIINTIQNDKIILTNSILDNNINIINNQDNKEYADNNDNNKIIENKNENIIEEKNELHNSENKIINNEEQQINTINNINKNNNDEQLINNQEKIEDKKEDKDDNNNIIEKLEEKIEESEKKLKEDKKELIKNESGTIHDEPLMEQNQSMNQSSFINQSSFMNQTVILAEQYVLISRDPDAPFSIENIFKFEKNQCLGILDFLTFQEKFQFTGINRAFNIERIYLLNNKREEMIRSLELSPRETLDDLIMSIRLKYSNDELSKNFVEYQIPRGAAKAVELLNNELYSKLFKKPILEKNANEICTVYRVLFTIFGEYEIADIYGDQLFWIKCTEYMIKNSNGKIGTFILDKMKDITFEHKKIFLLNKLLVGMKKKINPNYFSKICGTTGLLIFLIKETLEYCGVIINDKKTQPARIIDNLMYYKNSIDTLALFIDKLSAIKTYKIREKKEK